MDRWTLQYWKDGDWWLGTCLDFDRRFYAQERTEEECMVSLHAMIDDTVEHLRAHNLPVPNPGDAVRVMHGHYGSSFTVYGVPMAEVTSVTFTTTG